MAGKRSFGSIRKLPSGRFQASYDDPHGRLRLSKNGKSAAVRHAAPWTFHTKLDAESWLAAEYRLISAGAWTSPEERRRAALDAEQSRLPTFQEYAGRWIDQRKVKGKPLADRTKESYRNYLDRFLGPEFGHLHLNEIEPGHVNEWFDKFSPTRKGRKGDTGSAQRAKVYSFARAVMNTAVSAVGPLPGGINPFAVRGGGTAHSRRRDDHVATADEFAVMLAKIRPQWRPVLLLGLWCGLRFGEIAALRRSDIDFKSNTIRVRRAVNRIKGKVGDKDPKSEAGYRTMPMPGMVRDELKDHLNSIMTGRDGLIFPSASGGYLAPSSFYGDEKRAGTWYYARAAAGRDDLHFHDLRGSGATILAQLGAHEGELRAWLGDSTPQAAQRYVRASQSRMELLAERLNSVGAEGEW